MKNIIFSLFFIYAFNCNAQLYETTGTIPPGIKWEQINTDTVRVVFPVGLESQAQRITNMIHYETKNNKRSIGSISSKIDIFLINTGAISNGFVRPAPYHSKFYTMPAQYPFAGTIDWLDLLSIHEYRHVMQMNNAKQGMTKLVKIFFGDLGWSAGMFGAVPNWFWEGDAVQQETALSHSGRGRLPLFKSRFLSIMNLKKPFGYEKMRCGSFKDYIPDHYALGYQMVNYGRMQYGNDIWKKVFSDAVSYKGILWPFSHSLRKHTGFSTEKMYSEIVDSFKNSDINMSLLIDYAPDIYKSEIEKKNPSFYYGPHFISDKKIIVVKSSFDKTAKFVEVNIENKEEKDILPVSYNFGNFDTDGKKIVWNEINNNPRWAYESYSNIYSYDIGSKQTVKLTNGKNYFTPSISPDGKKLSVFEATGNLKYNVSILDSRNGEILKVLDNQDNYFYSYLDWVDATHIVAIAKNNNKNAIVEIDIENSVITELVPFTYITMQDLRYKDNKIFFSAPDLYYTNEQTLYYFDKQSSEIYKFSQKANYAVFSPDLSNDGKFAFCNLVFDNTVLQIKELHSVFDRSGAKVLKREFDIVDSKILEAEGGPIQEKIPSINYKVEKYSPAKHLIKFHSWYPSGIAPEYSAVFQSNDKLDKLSLSLVPAYNVIEKSFALGTYINYGGLYPVFSLGFVPKFNMHYIVDGNEYVSNYNDIKASVSFPLNYTRLNFEKKINTKLVYNISQYWNSNNEKQNNSLDQYLDLELLYSNHRKSSFRSFYPDFGYDLNATISDINFKYGFNSIVGYAQIYLPGIFANNSLRLRYNFLSVAGNTKRPTDISKYYFARGYDHFGTESMVNGLRINYSFPLVYPDIALGKFVFIKRIRTNLFFDIDRFENPVLDTYYKRSAGIEFLFDNVYFRTVTIPMGFGVNYLFDRYTRKNPVNVRFIIDF